MSTASIIFKAIKNALLGAVMLGALMLALQYAYERFTPSNFWVYYDSTSSTGRLIDGKLDMLSVSGYPRASTIIWSDQLFCDIPPGEGYRLYSSYIDSAYKQPAPLKESSWVYQGSAPPVGTTCYMVSGIKSETILGGEHYVTSQSNTFTVMDE